MRSGVPCHQLQLTNGSTPGGGRHSKAQASMRNVTSLALVYQKVLPPLGIGIEGYADSAAGLPRGLEPPAPPYSGPVAESRIVTTLLPTVWSSKYRLLLAS